MDGARPSRPAAGAREARGARALRRAVSSSVRVLNGFSALARSARRALLEQAAPTSPGVYPVRVAFPAAFSRHEADLAPARARAGRPRFPASRAAASTSRSSTPPSTGAIPTSAAGSTRGSTSSPSNEPADAQVNPQRSDARRAARDRAGRADRGLPRAPGPPRRRPRRDRVPAPGRRLAARREGRDAATPAATSCSPASTAPWDPERRRRRARRCAGRPVRPRRALRGLP